MPSHKVMVLAYTQGCTRDVVVGIIPVPAVMVTFFIEL